MLIFQQNSHVKFFCVALPKTVEVQGSTTELIFDGSFMRVCAERTVEIFQRKLEEHQRDDDAVVMEGANYDTISDRIKLFIQEYQKTKYLYIIVSAHGLVMDGTVYIEAPDCIVKLDEFIGFVKSYEKLHQSKVVLLFNAC